MFKLTQHARGLTLAGHLLTYEHRPEEALRLHERALATNRNLPLIWRLSGHAHSYIGDGAEAIRRINHARILSPTDPQDSFVMGALCIAHWVRGDFTSAAEAGQLGIALNPGYSSNYKAYLAAIGHLGDERAKRALATLLRLEPGFSVEQALRRSPFVNVAARNVYSEGLRAAGLR